MDKEIPSVENVERVMIGIILLDNSTLDIFYPAIQVNDLYNPRVREVYAAIIRVPGSNEINALTIYEQLTLVNNRFGITHTELLDFMHGAVRPTNKSLVKIVKDIKKTSIVRKLLEEHRACIERLWEGEEAYEKILETNEQRIGKLNNMLYQLDRVEGTVQNQGFATLKELAIPFKVLLGDYNQGKAAATPTGFAKLDEMLEGGGLQPSGLYFVGATPKTGKTSWCLKVARNIAFKQKKLVMYSTAEMSWQAMTKRLYSAEEAVRFEKFRAGFSGPEYDEAMEYKVDRFASELFNLSWTVFNVEDLRRHYYKKCEWAYKNNVPLGVGIVDYIQLFESDGSNWQTRANEVGKVSRELKKLASECAIPIIGISSLTREPLKEGRKPIMSDLRDAGSLEYDAEAILFLFNERFKPDVHFEPADEEEIDFIVEVNRNGKTGEFKLHFLGPYMDYMDDAEFNQYKQFDSGQHQKQFEKGMDEIEEGLFTNVPDDSIWDIEL